MNIDKKIDNLVSVLNQFKHQKDILSEISNVILECFSKNGKLLIAGNGGSAADASHIAGEFVGRFQKTRKSLPAINLAADLATVTCISNDYDFSEVFSRQISALSCEHDILIAISTSGRSVNIIKAVEAAKSLGVKTIAVTGRNGLKFPCSADISLNIESDVTSEIQSAYMFFMHLVCEIVDEAN